MGFAWFCHHSKCATCERPGRIRILAIIFDHAFDQVFDQVLVLSSFFLPATRQSHQNPKALVHHRMTTPPTNTEVKKHESNIPVNSPNVAVNTSKVFDLRHDSPEDAAIVLSNSLKMSSLSTTSAAKLVCFKSFRAE